MGKDRIKLHPFRAKLPAVVEIGGAASAEPGPQFPLLQRSLPEIHPHILLVEKILGATNQEIALAHAERTGEGNDRGRDDSRQADSPGQFLARRAQDRNAQRRKDERTRDYTQKSATASRENFARID